ncbi:MAG: hypothetical protein AAFP97_12065 [Pseudomonadota bacterium]
MIKELNETELVSISGGQGDLFGLAGPLHGLRLRNGPREETIFQWEALLRNIQSHGENDFEDFIGTIAINSDLGIPDPRPITREVVRPPIPPTGTDDHPPGALTRGLHDYFPDLFTSLGSIEGTFGARR